jgi:hypothetical protein
LSSSVPESTLPALSFPSSSVEEAELEDIGSAGPAVAVHTGNCIAKTGVFLKREGLEASSLLPQYSSGVPMQFANG